MSNASRSINLVLLGTLLPLMLAGCGSSPPVRYFSLEPVYEVVENSGEEQPIVGLGQLRTPNFLFRSQLVTRDRGGELIVHDFKRWSEPLDHAIHRVVAANIDRLLDDMTVVAFPYESAVKPAYRVHGSVERFDSDTAGEAVLIVQWGITQRNGTIVSPLRRGRYQSRAANTEDTASIVKALNDVLGSFSRDIAESLDNLSP
jgi:uncharacterized lipoprotein YmbA